MTSSILLVDLDSRAAEDRQLVGGKAAQLSRMRAYGLPVPPGFVVTTTAWRNLTAASDAMTTLRGLVGAALDEYRWSDGPLAIRSSTPAEDGDRASFAGVFDSVLDVHGTDEACTAIARVWESLGSPAAAAYARRVGADIVSGGMAVIVMPMLSAKVAGVGFTCDPRSGRGDRVVIEAVAGLADALLDGHESGEIYEFEEYPVDESLRAVSRPLHGLLSKALALHLAQLLRDSAEALDYAEPYFDFEWVWDGTYLQIVQARPVTARVQYRYPGLQGESQIWTSGNTRDVLPKPVGPLDWGGLRRGADLMLEQGYRMVGYSVLPGVHRVRLIDGRMFLNASVIEWEAWDAFGIPPATISRLMGGHHPSICVRPATTAERFRRWWYRLGFLVRTSAMRRRGRKEAEVGMSQCRGHRLRSWQISTDTDLITCFEGLQSTLRGLKGLMFMQGSSGGSLAMMLEILDAVCPGEGDGLAAALLVGDKRSVTAQQGCDLQELAAMAGREPAVMDWLADGAPYDVERLSPRSAFRRALTRFMVSYGHRGPFETYLSSPRLREAPGWLLREVRALAAFGAQERAVRNEQGGDAAMRRVAEIAPLKAVSLRLLARQARVEAADRELARSVLTAYSEVLRVIALEMGGRLQRRGVLISTEDVFLLGRREIAQALRGRLDQHSVKRRVRDRQAQLNRWHHKQSPDFVIDDCRTFREQPKPLGESWHGVGVSGGAVTGSACLVDSPAEGHALVDGGILVAPATDPAWIPLFLRASALVMETGGYLSHGATVARELGIPAVVNVPGIRSRISAGMRLTVDGTRGLVFFESG